MNRTSWTSLIALAGLALAAVQWMRMRSRPTGMRRVTHYMQGAMDSVMDRSRDMAGMVRKRVRM